MSQTSRSFNVKGSIRKSFHYKRWKMEWKQQKDFFYKIDQLHKLCFVTFIHQSETVKTCNRFASVLLFFPFWFLSFYLLILWSKWIVPTNVTMLKHYFIFASSIWETRCQKLIFLWQHLYLLCDQFYNSLACWKCFQQKIKKVYFLKSLSLSNAIFQWHSKGCIWFQNWFF